MTVLNVKTLDDRIKHLRERVAKGKVDPDVYAFTRAAITKRCGSRWCINEKDTAREAEAIFNAVRSSVRYTSDIAGIDTYQNPAKTLKLKAGDCDDYSSLICSSLLSAGIPCRFKVIRTKGSNEWNHIYAQVGIPRQRPTRWITMDASVPVSFGWEAPKSMVAESKIFPVG
jgi:transglutaminase-like putative cysteine protease